MAHVLMVGRGRPEQGGIPTVLETLLSGPLASKHELTFLNLSRRHSGPGGRLSPTNLVRVVTDTVALARRAKATDIVHIHSALAPTLTTVRLMVLCCAARVRARAAVVHVHGGLLPAALATRRGRLSVRAALAPADQVVVVASSAAEALGALLPPGRVRLVANGVDPLRFGPPEPGGGVPRILYAGVLTRRKGLGDLLVASRLLEERGVAHELLLAGGQPSEGRDAELQVRGLATSSTRFLGPQPLSAMPALYRTADVFCLPSWWEAMPVSVLEAMASGLPVVATDVGDVTRLVDHGVTGLVVPPKEPERLATALEHLLGDREGARTMGADGRERVVERFSAATTATQLSALYDELLERKS